MFNTVSPTSGDIEMFLVDKEEYQCVAKRKLYRIVPEFLTFPALVSSYFLIILYANTDFCFNCGNLELMAMEQLLPISEGITLIIPTCSGMGKTSSSNVKVFLMVTVKFVIKLGCRPYFNLVPSSAIVYFTLV